VLFSSTVFLFLFLPITLLIYYAVRPSFKNVVLLLSSLFFYVWGEPRFAVIMVISIAMNYVFALVVDTNREKKFKVKIILTIMVVSNLVLLGVFKYADFFLSNLNGVFNVDLPLTGIILPIGISFYTFQAISYVVDVYRGDGKVQKNPLNVALYISLFPQLVAGPIVRYQTVAEQIISRKDSIIKFSEGVKRFIIGLSKKLLLANNCGLVADQIFTQDAGQLTTGLAWIGIIAYTLQIYFDFSGYSDMAIGLGKMFGFDFLENFNYPYISKSVSEFWRRWHISLGSWFRDYVYIPLGGNRKGSFLTYRNLFVVWGLTGLWHGASWTFVVWGLYYGIFVMCEKAFLDRVFLSRIPSIFRHIYTLLIVMIGWVFFRSETITQAMTFIKILFGIEGNGLPTYSTEYYVSQYGVIILISIIAVTPIAKNIIGYLTNKASLQVQMVFNAVLQPMYYVSIMLITLFNMVSTTFNPFIYFRF